MPNRPYAWNAARQTIGKEFLADMADKGRAIGTSGRFKSRPGAELSANDTMRTSRIGGNTSDSAWGHFFGGNSPLGVAMGATPANSAIASAGSRIAAQLPQLAGSYVEPPSALATKPVTPTLAPVGTPNAPAMASLFQNPAGFATQNLWDKPAESSLFGDVNNSSTGYMDRLRRFGSTHRW